MARARTAKGGGKTQSGRSAGPIVLAFWNRALTVMRGTEADQFGDLTDVGTPYYTGIPAALAETTDVVFDAATQRQQIVRSITCIVPAWADIIDTDTLLDPFTGWYYLIESMQAEPGIGYYPAPKRLSLRMRSGVSILSD